MTDTQVIVRSEGWKIKVVLGLGGLAVLVIVAFLYRLEVSLILLTCGAIVAARLGFWTTTQYKLAKLTVRRQLAEVQQVELAAEKQRWEVQQEKAVAAKLMLDQYFIERKAGTFVIGNVPFQFYPSAAASRELATSQPLLALPAPALDYFSAMSDPLQAYAIVGPQRIGKSILAQHLAQHLSGNGRTCLVVGTKAKAGEWLNCKRYIGNEAVPEALATVLAETTQRLSQNRNTPGLCVFLDDWLNTVALTPDLAEQFFLEAATRMLTAGIVPYFLLQSDSKADWGTKHGAQLKNNFVHLILTAPRENGRLNHDKLNGVIIYPGEKEQHPVRLPAGLPALGESQPDIELAQPEPLLPDDQEQQIISLFNAGESMNAIARRVYGQRGGKQNQLIHEVLTKWGYQ
jgi:hypothetical protein